MELTVDQIAKAVQGRVIGNGDTVIRGVAGLGEANASDISFLRDAKNASALKLLENTSAGAIFVPAGIASNGKTFLEVKNPIAAFAIVLQMLAEEKKGPIKYGIHPLAYVAASARVSPKATVGPFCVIEEGAVIEDDAQLLSQVYVGRCSRVGKNSVLYPQVILREGVTVGERCIINPGTVIGSDGYGYYFAEGRHNKIPQVGVVIIEDDVEIGSCTAIDRATTGATIIKKGTKLDNLVHIAHNVEIGPHALITGQVGIAGSSKIGKGVVMGGQVGVADHVTVGDGVQVGAQSGIKNDVEPGVILFGSPAQPIQEAIKQMLLVRRLPELFKDVKKLKEKFTPDE